MSRDLKFKLWILPGVSVCLMFLACGSERGTDRDRAPATSDSAVKAPRDGLLLSGAFFKKTLKKNPTTNKDEIKNEPLPAQTLLVRPQGDGKPWAVEVLSCDDKSNVFHKAIPFTPVNGAPGILTIAAAKAGEAPAQLKLWRKSGSGFIGELLYSGVFGGKFDRLRDVEVGDVNGDKVDDIVVVTHQRGVTLVVEQKDGAYTATQVAGKTGEGEPPVWIHEVEIGDVDGNGINEFFTTPSEPNNLDGKLQPGDLKMFKYADGKYVETLIEHYSTRHAKEILCLDLDKSGKPELYASIEGEAIGAAGGATTQITRYEWKDGQMAREDLMPLPGKLCRFLVGADTDGDGQCELIASTNEDGIFALFSKDGAWTRRLIAPGAESKGFEHATTAFDWDGDGKDDVFAVSDGHKALQRFVYDAASGSYKMEKLLDIPADSLFIFNMERLPANW